MQRISPPKLKCNEKIDDLLNILVFGMAMNKIPCISTDLTEGFGFELSIKLTDLLEKLDADTKLDDNFIQTTGLMLFNLASELKDLNPKNKNKKICFDFVLENKVYDIGFNSINNVTIH